MKKLSVWAFSLSIQLMSNNGMAAAASVIADSERDLTARPVKVFNDDDHDSVTGPEFRIIGTTAEERLIEIFFEAKKDKDKYTTEYLDKCAGSAYTKGNNKLALELWKLSGSRGNPEALNNAGTMYFLGKGCGKEDKTKAEKFWDKSVKLGSRKGLNNLKLHFPTHATVIEHQKEEEKRAHHEAKVKAKERFVAEQKAIRAKKKEDRKKREKRAAAILVFNERMEMRKKEAAAEIAAARKAARPPRHKKIINLDSPSFSGAPI